MSNKTKRFILPEDEIPRYWYNIQADMVTKPMPPLNPATEALRWYAPTDWKKRSAHRHISTSRTRVSAPWVLTN